MFYESPIRSLVKGISWRFFASIDTFLLSFIISGKFIFAFHIALTEILTKIALYFLHERGWNLISWGKIGNKPTRLRSLTKSISWRILGTIDTIIISFFITGNTKIAFTIGSIEIFSKIIVYYIHERIWALIKWGRKFVANTIEKN